jgi:sugar phosphate isomerase/epimerase
LCGEGEFDIKGFIRCANSMGYTGPWAVEVFSQELTGLPLDALNTQAFNTTMAQFEE